MDATKVNRALIMFSAFISACVIMLIALSFKSNKDIRTLEIKYTIAQDSIRVTKNRLNQQTATVEVLTAEHNFAIQQLAIKDKEVIRLQNLVRSYEKQKGDLNTALTITTETVIRLQDSIQNLIVGYSELVDSLNDSTTVIYPIYSRDFSDEWKQGSVTMGLEMLDVSVVSKNEYDITIGEEKESLFKKKMYANITNLNPNTDTKVMKVYQKEPVKTKTFQKLTIGAIAGLVFGVLIK